MVRALFGGMGLLWVAMVLHCLLVQREFRVGGRWEWLMVLCVVPPLGPWIYLFVVVLGGDRLLARLDGAPVAQVRCVSCKHYLRHDRDGVLCGFGDKKVWKNYITVQYCSEHAPVRRELDAGRGDAP